MKLGMRYKPQMVGENGWFMKLGLPHYVTLFIWLVVLTILKNMKVNGKDYPMYYGKKWLKPPTSL
jgi:hypothetical protein